MTSNVRQCKITQVIFFFIKFLNQCKEQKKIIKSLKQRLGPLEEDLELAEMEYSSQVCSVRYGSVVLSGLRTIKGVITFLKEGAVVGFPNFAWGFKSRKNNLSLF
jgi:hypothetical protein